MTEGYVEVGAGDYALISGEAPTDSNEVVSENGGVLVDSTSALGVMLIREYMLAFEIIGLLLVAALIGGLLLMRNPPSSSKTEKGDASA